MRCDRCQEMVVEGVYCTRCGVRQGIPEELASRVAWRGSYAAHPGEHVLQPSFFSTLFPQLDPAQRCEFCWTLLAGLATIALLWIFGLIAAAILVAVGLLPVLYLLYLYAEQIDWRGWVLVMGLAVGAGVLLGIVTSFAASLLRPPLGIGVGDVWGDVNSIDWLVLLGFGISIPIIQEVVKPLPLLLLRRGNFSGVASGLTLGVAVGIGFSAALTVINFSALLVGQDLRAMAGNWIFPLLTIALLQPVMQGACTGLVAVAIWRKGDRIAVLGAVAGHLAFSLGSSLIGRFNLIGMLAWQMAV
ncbi:MAG: hypothetical protein ACREP9_19420, partial [Candidatus Dormibacteraceae bacterium]